jgi:S-DNA-T family DNA segregation ATPase FtsK/SpoIIIE
MASYQARQRDPGLDQSMQAMLERRGREALGLGLIALGAAFALMLMSYSANDPGWMVATDQVAHNLLGRLGASVASTLMTVGGLGSWCIPAVLVAWGVRFASHKGADRAVSRMVFAVIAVAMGSVYAATLVPGASWPHSFGLGGLFGDTILASLLNIMPGSAAVALKVLTLLIAAIFVSLMLYVTGFSLSELHRIARFLRFGLLVAFNGILLAMGRGAYGAGTAAQTMGARWQDRRASNALRAAEDYAQRKTAKDLARAAAIGTARMVDADEPALVATLGKTATLRADARPTAAPSTSRSGLLGRLLGRKSTGADSDDVIDLEMADDSDAPNQTRIAARITSVIRARTAQTEEIGAALDDADQGSSADAKPYGRAPLVIDPRASTPGLRLSEPPVTKSKSTTAHDSGWQDVADQAATDEWDGFDDAEIDDEDGDTQAFSRSALAADRRPIATLVQTPPVKRAAPSRQAMAEAQPRLNFDAEQDAGAGYELPPLSLLTPPSVVQRNQVSTEALEENARMLESVLEDYGVRGEIVSVRPGPVVTMYELEPAPGLKASRVIGLSDDIARSMSALSARVSTVPGRTVIGIELPNATREKVVLREILAAREFGDSALRLPLALGKDIGGEPIIANLAKMPHLLIAGTTGSGKSVAINTMILSLLYKLTPQECRLIMIDPKMLELSVYDGIPHLLSPVVTDPKKAVVALKWVVSEMEDRYRKMSKMGVRNIEGYNGRVREALSKNEMFKRTIQTGFDEDTGEPVFETDEFAPVTLPYIVVVVDEMADLMMVAGKEIEACIQRLAQMARASGIHLIMATQRPSVDVITGTIKANFPTRISFQVTSRIDSRTILGEQGAEQLLGMGDMLYMAGGAKITRIHGPFVSDEEVEEIVAHLKSFGPPEYMSGVVEGPEDENAAEIDSLLGLGGDGMDDTLYDQAVAIVARDRKCSTSYIQRKLGIGYNKAAKLVEQMEEHSVITAANHVGKREILIEER